MSRPRGVKTKAFEEFVRLFLNPFVNTYYENHSERPTYEHLTDTFFNAGTREVYSARLKHSSRFKGRLFITDKRYNSTTRIELPKDTRILFALDKKAKTCKIELEDGRCFALKEREWELFREKLTDFGKAGFTPEFSSSRHRDRVQRS